MTYGAHRIKLQSWETSKGTHPSGQNLRRNSRGLWLLVALIHQRMTSNHHWDISK